MFSELAEVDNRFPKLSNLLFKNVDYKLEIMTAPMGELSGKVDMYMLKWNAEGMRWKLMPELSVLHISSLDDGFRKIERKLP